MVVLASSRNHVFFESGGEGETHVTNTQGAVLKEENGSTTRRGVLLRGGVGLGLGAGLGSSACAGGALAAGRGLYSLQAKMFGEEVSLDRFDGQVTVVVNVASE